jgi:uncharacterized protein (DUF433 family)
MDYQEIITIEPGKRGGRPCIRHMRIAVADVLGHRRPKSSGYAAAISQPP